MNQHFPEKLLSSTTSPFCQHYGSRTQCFVPHKHLAAQPLT
jgi:hypothetical protein